MSPRWIGCRWIALLALVLGGMVTAGCGGSIGGLADDIRDDIDDDDGGPPPPAPTGDPTQDEAALALDCFDLLNAQRSEEGLDELLWLDPASDAAFLHSLDMDVRNFFDHDNPDGDGPGDRLSAQGVAWTFCAENIARGYVDAEDVMEGWMNSEGHRDNMLSSTYTHVGIGVRYAGGGPFWTQDFVR
jgi:uncharacterized protein YkwD